MQIFEKWSLEQQVTHRNARQPGSPTTVTAFNLWCKDVMDSLNPAAALNHVASSVALCIPAAVIVFPPLA